MLGEIGMKTCAEVAQNAQKWCAEFAGYAHRILNFFSTQNSNNLILNNTT